MKNFDRNNRIFLKNLKTKIPFLVVVFAFIFYINFAKSAFNEQLNYQGKLTGTTNNQAVADGSYNIEFKLYTASTGGSPVWTETCTSTNKVSIVNGLFSHLLGSVNTLDDSIFNQDLYLSINIGGTSTPSWDGEMTPRKKLGSVASAFEAKRLGGKLESQFGAIAETESISGLWTFLATTTMATTTISSSTITTLYAGNLNVNGTSSTLWDQAYNYFNASSTNLNRTHFIVNNSSTNWDIAYVKGLNAYEYAHATATENVAGLEFSGQQLNLTTGYEIPTTVSTGDWTSSSNALNANDGKWTEAYSYAHATATENVIGLEFNGQELNTSTGYFIPTNASGTDWASTSQALNTNDGNWTLAYSIVNSSSSNWDSTHFKVNTSSTYWDTAYSKINSSSTYWDTAYNRLTGTMTDNKYCIWNETQGKIVCNSDISATGLASLNGLTASTQTFTTTTGTGLDFKIISSGSAHDFRASIASGYQLMSDATSTEFASSSNKVIKTASNWDSAYSTVNSNSSNWDTAYNRLTGTMTDNKYCIWNNTLGKIVCNSEGGTGSGVPGGSNGELQFKTGSDFGGDSDLNWNSSTNALSLIGGGGLKLGSVYDSSGGSYIGFVNKSGQSANEIIFQQASSGGGWIQNDMRISNVLGSALAFYQYGSSEYGLMVGSSNVTIGGASLDTDSTFSIFNNSTYSIMNVMTSTTKPAMYIANKGQVGIGTTTPALALSIEGGLQLGPTTTAPVEINGTMYYDASTNKFTCYQNGGWRDCIGGDPSGSDSYVQYNNSGVLGGQQYFAYDDTNHRLGIGTSTPTSTLEVYASTTNPAISITAGENTSYDPELKFLVGATPATKIKFAYDTSDTDFRIVKGDDITASIGLEISDNLNVGIATSSRNGYGLNTTAAYFESTVIAASNVTMTGASAAFDMTGVSSILKVHGNIRYGGTLTNAYPDLAEKFPTQDNNIEAGDVVAIDILNKENVAKTNSAYQINAMGVVSTQPGIIMGSLMEDLSIGQGKDVALAGRIPVKINLNNGEIKAGDYLTSSDVPGVAMKATKAGKVLGMAMQNYTQTDLDGGKKTIIMFVDPQFLGNDLAFIQSTDGNILNQSDIDLEKIKTKLADIGIVVNTNGYLEATTIKTKKLATEEIELTDKSTGEIYCIWYQNGTRQEQKGKCEDIFGNSDVPASGEAIPADTTNPPISTTTSTTTTPDATTTQPTEEPVLPQNPEPIIEPVIQNNVVNEPAPAPTQPTGDVGEAMPEALPTETPSQ